MTFFYHFNFSNKGFNTLILVVITLVITIYHFNFSGNSVSDKRFTILILDSNNFNDKSFTILILVVITLVIKVLPF